MGTKARVESLSEFGTATWEGFVWVFCSVLSVTFCSMSVEISLDEVMKAR